MESPTVSAARFKTLRSQAARRRVVRCSSPQRSIADHLLEARICELESEIGSLEDCDRSGREHEEVVQLFALLLQLGVGRLCPKRRLVPLPQPQLRGLAAQVARLIVNARVEHRQAATMDKWNVVCLGFELGNVSSAAFLKDRVVAPLLAAARAEGLLEA
jgi:hypothetical protein